MTQDFDVIVKSLKRTRVIYITGILYLLGCLVIVRTVYQFFFGNQGTAPANETSSPINVGMNVLVALIAVATLLYGIQFILHGIRLWNVQQSPFYLLLKEYPHHIVWIFARPQKDSIEPSTVNVWLFDHKKHLLYVKQAEKDALIQALSRFAPNARLGYQPEWVKEYKQDPSTFGAIPKADSQ